MPFLPKGGKWSKNPPNERAIVLRKDPTGPAVLRRSLTTTKGKKVSFNMLKYHESCTNATGSENGEPGRLNHCNRAYGREDMPVRSIAGKTGLSGERSHFKAFGSGERKRISRNAFSESESVFTAAVDENTLFLRESAFRTMQQLITLSPRGSVFSKYAFDA